MKIERPDWYEVLEVKTIANIYKTHLNRAWDKAVGPVNKMLSDGVEVTTANGSDWNDEYAINLTHKALLINIEPIKEESAEDILRDIFNQYKDMSGGDIREDWAARARKLLEKK